VAASVYGSTNQEEGRGQPMKRPSVDETKHGREQGTLSPLLNVPEAAALLGIKTWTLRQWLSQRRIAFVKVGRLTRLQLEDIEAFIEQGRREAISHERHGQHEAA
jgi:excisionase family DNA binding protein